MPSTLRPCCACRRDGAVQALRAQPGQVAGGVLGAGQDDPVGPGHVGGRTRPHQPHARNVLQRLEFVEVADARVRDDRDGPAHATGRDGALIEDAVFLRQAMAPPHRQRGDRGDAGEVLQHSGPGLEQRGVAAELVEHEAADELALALVQQGPRAVQVGEGAAAVDVGHQQAARLRMLRDAQVDDVAVHQVDLGGRAGAFDHHHVVVLAQFIERAGDHGPHLRAALVPWNAGQGLVHLPQQHHLAVGVVLGLEQQRVHAHVRLGPRGQRLEVLRAADLAAGNDTRVVAHVLRLEGRHLQAAPRIPAAQRGGQPALAGAAGRAQHHDAACAHRPALIRWAARTTAPPANGCPRAHGTPPPALDASRAACTRPGARRGRCPSPPSRRRAGPS